MMLIGIAVGWLALQRTNRKSFKEDSYARQLINYIHVKPRPPQYTDVAN